MGLIKDGDGKEVTDPTGTDGEGRITLMFPAPLADDGSQLSELTLMGMVANGTVQAVTWDGYDEQWITDYCEVVGVEYVKYSFVAECTHLTDFSVLLAEDSSAAESGQGGGDSNVVAWAVPVAVIVAVLCACIVVGGVIGAVVVVAVKRGSGTVRIEGTLESD